MTAAELSEFIAGLRVECDARLALLAATDPTTLPLELRDEYHQGGCRLGRDAGAYRGGRSHAALAAASELAYNLK